MRARDQFRAKVVFVGAATPSREQLLAELTEFGLAIWGPGWRRTPLKDYCRGEMLDLDDYVRAYAGASVAVNIHREGPRAGGTTTTGCNQRLFELAAIGVPQVVDNRADLPLAFDVGRELLTFDTGSELRQLVQELIQDPTAADRLAQAGRRRALAEHTYMHRLGGDPGSHQVNLIARYPPRTRSRSPAGPASPGPSSGTSPPATALPCPAAQPAFCPSVARPIAATTSSGFSAFTSNPVSSSATTSGIPPLRAAITGRPHAAPQRTRSRIPRRPGRPVATGLRTPWRGCKAQGGRRPARR